MTTDSEQFVAGYVEAALWSSNIGEDFAQLWATAKGETSRLT